MDLLTDNGMEWRRQKLVQFSLPINIPFPFLFVVSIGQRDLLLWLQPRVGFERGREA